MSSDIGNIKKQEKASSNYVNQGNVVNVDECCSGEGQVVVEKDQESPIAAALTGDTAGQTFDATAENVSVMQHEEALTKTSTKTEETDETEGVSAEKSSNFDNHSSFAPLQSNSRSGNDTDRLNLSPNEQIYQIKWIDFYNKARIPIITQNENGPCPLLAISNVLLLRGQIEIPSDIEVVTAAQLIERLGDCILRLAPEKLAEHLRTDYERNVADAVAVLPKLVTGLDVNVRFTGVSDFEYTNECTVFDLLAIPLYHGWLVDPQQTQLVEVIGHKSYNQLVERIIRLEWSEDVDEQTEALLASGFLQCSASQLTYHGICQLNQYLRDGHLSVLFRNNHFSTLLKNGNELFLLVTDQGFLHERNVVWETLNNVEGDSHFVDSQFHTVAASSQSLQPVQSAVSTEHDYLMALSLEEQEKVACSSTAASNTSPHDSSALPSNQSLVRVETDEEIAKRLQCLEYERYSTERGHAIGTGSGQAEGAERRNQADPVSNPHKGKNCSIT